MGGETRSVSEPNPRAPGYSYPSASIGFRRAAFRADHRPNPTPSPTGTAKPTTRAHKGDVGRHDAADEKRDA